MLIYVNLCQSMLIYVNLCWKRRENERAKPLDERNKGRFHEAIAPYYTLDFLTNDRAGVNSVFAIQFQFQFR